MREQREPGHGERDAGPARDLHGPAEQGAREERDDEHREPRHREVDVALVDVLPKPSATSMTPMRIRKTSARILIVGWRSTKSPIGPAKTSITRTAITIAATITDRAGPCRPR